MANLSQMTSNQPYSNSAQVENAMKVVAPWIAKNSNCKINYHDGTAVMANCATGQIDIPRTGHLDEESLMKLRSWIYHESGHIAETTIKRKPPGALGEVVNALEDRRMEAAIAKDHIGCRQVFNWASRYYNKTIGGQIQRGEIDAPLWEALCAMGLQSEGLTPAWVLNPKAQAYFDAAYDDFCEWNSCDNTEEILELAEEVLKKMRIAKEEYEDQNQPEEPQESEEEEDSDGNGENSGEGESEEGEEEDSDGEGTGDGEGDEEGEGEEGQGGGGEEEGGKADEENNEPQQGGQADIEEEGDQGKGGEGEGGEEDGDGEGIGGGDGDVENNQSDGQEAGDNNSSYDTEYSDSNGSKKSEPEKDREMDAEASGGKAKDEVLADEIQEAIESLEPADRDYTADKDADVHEVVQTSLEDKARYQDEKRELAKDITGMSRMLEQALRSMARCKKQPYLENGKIDSRRHVAIAKSLSRQVFHTTRKGQKLDTAVAILLDESGSMGNYREVRQLVIAISETLAAMKVPFEIIGTTTVHWGSDLPALKINSGFSRSNPMHYRHYKFFDEQWSTVSQRIVHTSHHKHNVDGEAVEFAAMRLAQRKESRKIIFSLSDGLPDAGHGNGRALGKNIQRVCERSRAAGIEVYGFGIGTDMPEEFYGSEHFIYLDAYDGMGDTFFRKFADIITKGKFKVGARA